MASFDLLGRIGRPAQAHEVHTPEAYRAWAAAVIANNRTHRPSLNWRDPFLALDPVQPFINGGRWGVLCGHCANLAIYDPEWQMACCAECGAIYERVAPPAHYALLEAVLMARPERGTRHWNTEHRLGIGAAETLADLAAQNAAAGDPVPLAVQQAIAPAQGEA